jgi:hypothetical protein
MEARSFQEKQSFCLATPVLPLFGIQDQVGVSNLDLLESINLISADPWPEFPRDLTYLPKLTTDYMIQLTAISTI